MNLQKHRGQLIAIIVVFVIGVTLAMLPHKSSVVPVKEEVTESKETLSVDEKIETAVEIITSGKGAPMRGISLLKEVLEEDPKNTKALYYLGVFSIAR